MLPSYITLYKSGELKKRVNFLKEILKNCTLCPRKCMVNRERGELGYCKAPYKPVISSYFPHFGEEKILVGKNGSGTIFFTFCNLGCVFCQNYTISHLGVGEEMSTEDLAYIMIYLQNLGCHNINLVTPTHFISQIIEALLKAIEFGLKIPIVYNTSGYESLETLKLLDGIVDIYMPDIKFYYPETAKKFANAEDYPEVTKSALKEMYRQVGNLILNEENIALKGLIIRHLLMPNHISELREWLIFIKKELSTEVFINIMEQYRPLYMAYKYPEINRTINYKEYQEAISIAKNLGFKNLYLY
ncbi:Radical SAM domain protein [Dictyoglomus turgidum DSM 6724]|jgi:putative pyruvate formate lyase activating enzyme|uniref:Radical SAM domain protein n=1 Tax=Dictyoglomus turgidum (strain DSM 6724 / Z-1310) TaxID=515635 RepID=B8E303_DICTD|nr:Radical SAM domain protein [Dictyoglomus turgidum DSM 6724]PNV79935.1 MAG: radical SAM protein [Dictyoglomus turgidum]HBU32292.1 radical SAM protein [Dictyoglomus sp.]